MALIRLALEKWCQWCLLVLEQSNAEGAREGSDINTSWKLVTNTSLQYLARPKAHPRPPREGMGGLSSLNLRRQFSDSMFTGITPGLFGKPQIPSVPHLIN